MCRTYNYIISLCLSTYINSITWSILIKLLYLYLYCYSHLLYSLHYFLMNFINNSICTTCTNIYSITITTFLLLNLPIYHYLNYQLSYLHKCYEYYYILITGFANRWSLVTCTNWYSYTVIFINI